MNSFLIYFLLNFVYCGGIFTGELDTAFDVVIVADSTDFVGEIDWALEQTVIKNAMSIFRVGKCYTRILGLVRYGSEAAITLPLVDIQKSNNYNVEKHLDEIGLLGGNMSNLAAGLEAAAEIFGGCFDRPDILNVAIIITSSNNCTEEILRAASEKLKHEAFVVTFALDVGRNIQQHEVDLVSTITAGQLHYMRYYEAVTFFRNMGPFRKECGVIDCHVCPDFYISGELKASNSSFLSKISHRTDILNQTYLKGGNGYVVLDHNDTVTIWRPLEDMAKFRKIRVRNMTYFKFQRICMETLYAEEVYISGKGKYKEPLYRLTIPDSLTQHWTQNCIVGSTFYNWRKLKVGFTVPQSSPYGSHPKVLLRNLYMKGCYSSKKIPFIKMDRRGLP